MGYGREGVSIIMVKKAALATGLFAVSVLSSATMAFAQTAAPTVSPTTTTVTSTPMPTTAATMPSHAPATGRAN